MVDFATTLRRHDPAIGAHSQGAAGPGVPGRRGPRPPFRAIWPDGKTIRWRETEGLPAPVMTHAKGQT